MGGARAEPDGDRAIDQALAYAEIGLPDEQILQALEYERAGAKSPCRIKADFERLKKSGRLEAARIVGQARPLLALQRNVRKDGVDPKVQNTAAQALLRHHAQLEGLDGAVRRELQRLLSLDPAALEAELLKLREQLGRK